MIKLLLLTAAGATPTEEAQLPGLAPPMQGDLDVNTATGCLVLAGLPPGARREQLEAECSRFGALDGVTLLAGGAAYVFFQDLGCLSSFDLAQCLLHHLGQIVLLCFLSQSLQQASRYAQVVSANICRSAGRRRCAMRRCAASPHLAHLPWQCVLAIWTLMGAALLTAAELHHPLKVQTP